MRFSFAAVASVLAAAGSASALFSTNWTVPDEITSGQEFEVTFQRSNSLTNNDQYGILFGLDGHEYSQGDSAIGSYFGWVDLVSRGQQASADPLTLKVTVPSGTESYAYGSSANFSAVVWGVVGASGGLNPTVLHKKVSYKPPASH